MTSACASVPDLGPKPVPHAASDYASSRVARGHAVGVARGRLVDAYSDAQLDRLIGRGPGRFADLAAAAARFRRAQGLAQQAGAALLPRSTPTPRRGYEAEPQSRHLPGPQRLATTTGTPALGLQLRPRPVGQEPRRAARPPARTPERALATTTQEARLMLTTGIAAAYADLAALYAQRDVSRARSTFARRR